MVPDSLDGLVGFLFLVLPGAAFGSVRARQRPTLTATTFDEINTVVITSIATWITVAIIAALVPAPNDSTLLAEALDALATPALTLAVSPGQTLPLLIVLATAVGGAAGAAWWVTRDDDDFADATLWFHVLRSDRPENSRVWLWVTLDDGDTIGGYLAAADYRDVPLDERDLMLTGVVHPHDHGDDGRPPQSLALLSGRDVRRIEVSYVVAAPGSGD